MKHRLITKTLTGLFIGALIGNVVTLLVNYFTEGKWMICMPELIERFGLGGAIALQTLLSGIFGAISLGSMCFHDIDGWNMLRSSIAHCLTILISFIPAGLALYWFSFDISSILIISGVIIICYSIIWLIMYILWKREMREMTILNEEYNKN